MGILAFFCMIAGSLMTINGLVAVDTLLFWGGLGLIGLSNLINVEEQQPDGR